MCEEDVYVMVQMTSQQYGPVEEKLRGKERERKALCQNRDEAEAVSKAELDTLKSAVDTIKTSTKQISKYTTLHIHMHIQHVSHANCVCVCV